MSSRYRDLSELDAQNYLNNIANSSNPNQGGALANKEAEQMLEDRKRKQVAQEVNTTRALADRGAQTEINPQTGKPVLSRHEDGAVKFTPKVDDVKPISQTQTRTLPVVNKEGKVTGTEATPSLDYNIMLGAERVSGDYQGPNGPKGSGESTMAYTGVQTETQYGQTGIDNRGNPVVVPTKPTFDPKTGRNYIEREDPVTGTKVKVSAGADLAEQAKLGRKMMIEDESAQLDMRENAIKQQKLAITPMWEPVKKEYDEANAQVAKLPSDLQKRGEQWVKVNPETGEETLATPFEVARRKTLQDQAYSRANAAAQAYSKISPRVTALEQAEQEAAAKKLEIERRKIRLDNDLPDNDGGAADILAWQEENQRRGIDPKDAPPYREVGEYIAGDPNIPTLRTDELPDEDEIEALQTNVPTTPNQNFTEPRPLLTRESDQEALKSAFGALRGIESLNVETKELVSANGTKSQLHKLTRDGVPIAYVTNGGFAPVVELTKQGRTQGDVLEMINTGATQGIPLYMQSNPNRKRLTDEAAEVASIFAASKNPDFYDVNGKATPKLGEEMKRLRATPQEIMQRVDQGELSVQHGQAILKEVFGTTMEASNPKDPKEFAKWVAETTAKANKELQAKYGKDNLRASNTPAERVKNFNTGLTPNYADRDNLQKDFLVDKYIENAGKPGVRRSDYVRMHNEVNSGANAGLIDKGAAFAGFLGKTGKEVVGSMIGLAAGAFAQSGAGIVSFTGDEKAQATFDEFMKVRNLSTEQFVVGLERNRQVWFTGRGKKAMGELDFATKNFQETIDREMDKPEAERDQAAIQAAKQQIIKGALALHALNDDGQNPITADNVDPDKDPALMASLARYVKTADPRMFEEFKARLLSNNLGRELSVEMDKKVRQDGFFGAIEGGMYAGWQELGTEMLADASMLVTAGGSKGLQNALRFAGATNKAMKVERAVAAVGSAIDKLNDFGIKAESLINPLTRVDKARNAVVGGAKTLVQAGVGEAAEEMIVEAGADDPNLVQAGLVGAVGGVILTPAFYPMQRAIQKGQVKDAERALQFENRKFAQSYNERNADVPGFEPITHEVAGAARQLLNVSNYEQRMGEAVNRIQTAKSPEDVQAAIKEMEALAPMSERAIDAAREIAAMPDPAQRTFYSGIAKVAAGNAASLTTAERAAVQQAQTDQGNPYFANVNGVEVITDEARAEIAMNAPLVGSIIETTESTAIAATQFQQQAQQTNEQNTQGQPGQEAAPQAAPTQAATQQVQPVANGGGTGGTGQAQGQTQAPAITEMEAAEYAAAQQADPSLPSMEQAVTTAFSQGQPVSVSMATQTDISPPSGYVRQGSRFVSVDSQAAANQATATNSQAGAENSVDPTVDKTKGQNPGQNSPARQTAERVKAAVEANFPAMKGRINIVEELMSDGNGGVRQSGGVYADDKNGISLSLPDIEREMQGVDPAAYDAILTDMVIRHEIVHVIQYEAIRAMQKAQGGKASFETFFRAFYGKMATEFAPEVFAAARKIYGAKSWDAIPEDALKAAEVVRMLVEAKLNPDQADKFSELSRAIELQVSPSLLELIKTAVVVLINMVQTGALPESARKHIEEVAAMYQAMTNPVAQQAAVPTGSLPDGQSPTSRDVGESVGLRIEATGDTAQILNGDAVLWQGKTDQAEAQLKLLQDAEGSTMQLVGQALMRAFEKNPQITAKQKEQLYDLVDELEQSLEGMNPEEMSKEVERSIAEWLDSQEETKAEKEREKAASKGRNIDTPARRKAKKLVNSGQFPAITAILDSGMKIAPRPNRIGLILSRKRQGKRLTNEEIRLLNNDQDYNGSLTQSMFDRSGDGAVAREVVSMLMARQGEGITPDEMAGYYRDGATSSELWEQLDKEVTAISRGKTAMEGDALDPNRERTDADIERELAERKARGEWVGDEEAQLPTLSEIASQMDEAYGENTDLAAKLRIIEPMLESFPEPQRIAMQQAAVEEQQRIEAGVISAVKWQEMNPELGPFAAWFQRLLDNHSRESMKNAMNRLRSPKVQEQLSNMTLGSSPSNQRSLDFGVTGDLGTRNQLGFDFGAMEPLAQGPRAKAKEAAQAAFDKLPEGSPGRDRIAGDIARREGLADPQAFIDAATKPAEPPKKASTQINLPPAIAKQIMDFSATIPESEISSTEENTGRETEPHVTVLYGLTSNNANQATKALEGMGNIKVKLGKTSLFENEKYDVLKIDVISDDLRRANKALRDNVDFENDYPDYKPHVTIAYLKPGEGKKYAGMDNFEGIEFNADEVLYSGKEREKTPIQLSKPTAKESLTLQPKADEITDFGEKIGGARKDYAQTFADAKQLDIASEPFSKVWPEPNYKKLIADGIDPYVVGFIRAMRDEVPVKPRRSWRMNTYIQQVEALREMAGSLISGEISQDTFKEMLRSPKYENLNNEVGGRAELYQEMGHDQSFKGFRFRHTFYNLYKGEPNVWKWEITKPAKATAFGNMPMTLAEGNSREEVLAKFKALVTGKDLSEKPKIKFDIYRYNNKSVFHIGKKIGRHTADLFTFETAKEARDYLRENYDDVVARLESYKKIGEERRTENSPRIGADHLKGRDITPAIFQDAFGFRGVEFGNYVEQKRRQSDLNRAYEALMDLSGILNISPKALSLDGTLGLAFGARGSGGKNAAAAHYESGKVVINLTKNNGPGSLAHEWFHAMDNYFLRQVGKPMEFATAKRGTGWGARLEVMEAFGNIIKTIDQTGLRKRSNNLDKKRSNPYWSTDIELSARAFENYVIARMQAAKSSNDYLVNISDISEYAESMIEAMFEGNTAQDLYPYLTEDEIGPVVEAFDQLFEKIKTKPTEKGIALYSSPGTPRGEQQDLFSAVSKPDAKEALGDVKAGRTHALNAYRALTAKRAAGRTLTAAEEQQLLDAETALGQKLAFDMEELRKESDPEPTPPQPPVSRPRADQQDMMLGGETLKGGQITLFSSPASFYSPLQRAIEAKIPARATPEQIMATVRGANVKEEEIKWSGIEMALSSLAVDGKVSKDTLLDYLRGEGSVRFEEAIMGQSTEPNIREEKADDGTDGFALYNGDEFIDWYETREQAEANITNLERVSGGTKYAQYQLPGGKNYREVVLAMPEKGEATQRNVKAEFIREKNGVNEYRIFSDGRDVGTEFGGNEAEAIASYVAQGSSYTTAGKYTSSHFQDIPNYVAHMRLNERTDAEGNEGLFIEEIQSDRHQEGRKKGYSSDEISARLEGDNYVVTTPTGERRLNAMNFNNQQEAVDFIRRQTIADAPFRTTWPLAMFKRALRDAVASGKDWIGWTSGETQNERYDLSKQVSQIAYYQNTLQAWDKQGDQVIGKTVAKENLEDHIGKDLAKRLLEAEPDADGTKWLKGQDLKVGGSGMKGFYDNMLPKEIGKYVKQWGATVEKSEIGQSIDMDDLDMGELDDATPEELAELRANGSVQGDAVPIWRVNITPEMASSIQSEGLALFSSPSDIRPASTLDQAKEAAKSFISTPITNSNDGLIATVSKNALLKMTSESAVNKSASLKAHALAVANLDNLFKDAIRTHSGPDENNDPNIAAMHRYYAPFQIGDQMLAAKMTVKEFSRQSEGSRIYTVESMDIVKPAGNWVASISEERRNYTPQAGFEEKLQSKIDKIKENSLSMIFASLTGSRSSAKLSLSDELLNELREAFGDVENDFRAKLGYGFDELTESEARALVRFRPADTVRSRILAKGNESGINLDEKGTPKSLGSSPSPEPSSEAVQEALAKMPPIYRKVFEAVNDGDSPAMIAEKFSLTDRAVTNILNQVNSRIRTATKAADGDLAPKMKEGKIDGGRPDLALGGNKAVAAIDQIRNESGVPDKRGWGEVNAQAQKMLKDDYQGTYDKMLEKARNLEQMTDLEVAVTKRIIARETMEGRITTPEERTKMAMLIHGYRDIGTETARALAIRRDPEMKPAERHAQFIAEALFSPDPKTRARLRKSSPTDQQSILAGWMSRVDKIKAELKARGIDLDASLAAFNARKQEMEAAAELSPRTAEIIEDSIRKLTKREKTIVEALRPGQTTYEGAAYLTGVTKEEAKAIYSAWVNGIKTAMKESAQRYLATTLGSSPSNVMSNILDELGVVDPDLIAMDEADRPRVEAEKASRKPQKPRKPRKKKEKSADEPGAEAIAPKGTTVTPEMEAKWAEAAERFRNAPPSTWKTLWQIEMENLKPMFGTIPFGKVEQVFGPAWKAEQVEMFPEPRKPINETTGEGRTNGDVLFRGTHIDSKFLINDRKADIRAKFTELEDGTQLKRHETKDGKVTWEVIGGAFDLNDPYMMKQVIDAFALARGTKMDALMEYWRMSILTGPQTAIVNVGSNVLHTGYRLLPRRAVEASTNSILSLIGMGSQESATFGEFSAMAKELRNGLALASRMALSSWRLETRTFEAYAKAEAIDLTASGGVGREYIPPALGGKFGKIMRSLSFRHMTAADQFIKGFTGQLESAAQAHRIAKVEEKLSGSAYEARIKELMEPGSVAWIRAMDEVDTITFQNELDGTNPQVLARIDQIAEYLKHGRNLPWLGKPLTLFLPFIETPTNIFKQAVQMTPIGLVASVIDGARALNRKLNRGGLSKEQADQEAALLYNRARLVQDITNQTIGLAVYFSIASLLQSDDDEELPFITGTMSYKSTQKGERDNAYAVMPEQSIRIGGVTMSYRRWEPFATVLASMVDFVRAKEANGGMNASAWSEWMSGFNNQMSDKTFLQGLSNLQDAIKEPDRFGTRLTTNIVTGLVPNAIRQPIRVADPMLRDTRPRGDQGLFETLARSVGYSVVPQQAPIRMDVWGNEIRKNRGDLIGGNQITDSALRILDPSNITVNPDIDPIDRWIYQWNMSTADSGDRIAIIPITDTISITPPGKSRAVRVPLTPEEQAEANRNAGQAARAMLDSIDWNNAPKEESMAKQIKDVVSAAQKAERARLRLKKLSEGLTIGE